MNEKSQGGKKVRGQEKEVVSVCVMLIENYGSLSTYCWIAA